MNKYPVVRNVKDFIKAVKKLPKGSIIIFDEAKKYTKKEWNDMFKQLKGGNK